MPQNPLTILQVSDCHLYASADVCLAGLNTRDSFGEVIADARNRLSSVDLLIASGDLVHDESKQGYDFIGQELSAFGCPVYCVPGNHDSLPMMKQCLEKDSLFTLGSIQKQGWSIIFLDSTIKGEDAGYLAAPALAVLEKELGRHPQDHTLVVLHHHPLPVGSPWLDTMCLQNSQDLFSILARHAQVRAVLFGHIHQEYDAEHQGLRLLGTPSTCFQFTPKKVDFGIDAIAPGYRSLRLMGNGEIQTEVHRLDRIPEQLDTGTSGY